MIDDPKLTPEPHQRLRKARELAGYDTASAAAEAMGVKIATYIHHENGTAGLARAGRRYAAFFRISLDWLLAGRGSMRGAEAVTVPIYGVVGAGSRTIPITEDAASAEMGEMSIPVGPHIGALRVYGESALPLAEDGDWILFDRRPLRPDLMVKRLCVVETVDGRRLFKRLMRGTTGKFSLISLNANAEHDVEVLATYRYMGCIPAHS